MHPQINTFWSIIIITWYNRHIYDIDYKYHMNLHEIKL